MDMTAPLRLIDRLRDCAQAWADANGATPARLGRLAINDSSYFNRVESPQGTTTATLEKFARFLSDAANWPEGRVPCEVCDFAHVVGISSAACGSSAGNAGQSSGEQFSEAAE
jgi:hypothetical protein